MLAQLLSAKAAQAFLARAWPDRHFLVHRKPDELPAPLRESPVRSFDELCAAYTGRIQVAGGKGVDHLQFSVAGTSTEYLRRIGLTVFFGDDVSPLVSGGPELLRGLEASLGAPPGIGAIRMFCSPRGGGLGAHYDQGETFIVQLTGHKRLWLARNTTYPALQFAPGKPPSADHYPEFAARGFPARAPKQGITVTMKPGSVLFVPRGMWHRTQAGSASWSASICVDVPNAADVLLPQLRAMLKEDVRFRRPLYGAWGVGRRPAEAQLKAALRDAARALARMSPDLMLDSVGEVKAAALPIRRSTRFQRVPSTTLALRGRRLTVTTWARKRVVKLELLPALLSVARRLTKPGPAFTLAGLLRRGGDPEQVAELLRALLDAEALEWLPFPRLDTRG